MAILFAGSEPEGFVLSPASSVAASTTAGRFNSTMCRACTYISDPTSAYVSATTANITDFWLRFSYYNASSAATMVFCRLIDSVTGTGLIRIEQVGSTSVRLAYWNGSAFVYITSAAPSSALEVYDVRVIISASGSISFYRNSVLVGTFSGNTAALFTSVSSVRFGVTATAVPIGISEVIIANEDTRGMNVCTLLPNGSGTTSQWTGAYTDISGTTYGDTTFISDSTNGDVSTFAASDLPSTSYDVIALSINARASIGTSGPQNMQLALRTNSVNYFSGNVSGLSTAFGPVSNIWAVSPDTSAAWTPANINALEIGVKAIT
jgi:hypothetical protein